MAETILAIERLTKRFGGLTATNDLSLAVEKGEVHAVIGPNGAGKTTLIAQLSGLLAPDSGRIVFGGRDITTMPAHTRSAIGLARSFQVTSIFQNFTTEDNVALAVQAHAGHSFRFVRAARAEAALREPARAALARVGLQHRANVVAADLSHGEQRQLEIAMAIATKPSVLLLDEPMAGMGPEESARMIDVLKGFKGTHTLLLIEHDMDAVFKLADRITVLVYGQAIATGTPDAIRANPEVRRAYLGDEAWGPMFEIAEIKTFYGQSQVLFGMSLAVKAGEVITLMGRNGMGKTTTIRSIMGLTPCREGRIYFEGREIQDLPSYAVARLGLGLVPEGRQIFPNLTVEENLVATAHNRTDAKAPWTLKRIYELFPGIAERRTNMGNQLSGGEQQMLAVGRALMTNPRLLILDEATEGLAPLIRQEIWSTLEKLKAAGQSILVVDKNVEALARIADRHYIIEKGRVVWTGSSPALQADKELQHRYLGV